MVEVSMNLVHIVKIKTIVKFSEFENHIDHFWFICPIQTSMLFPIENAFATLKNKVGTYRILSIVKCFIPLFLFWQKHNCTVVFRLVFVIISNSISNITPHIGGIVSVQVNDAWGLLMDLFAANSTTANVLAILSIKHIAFCLPLVTEARDLIKIVMIGLAPYNINHFVERGFGVNG